MSLVHSQSLVRDRSKSGSQRKEYDEKAAQPGATDNLGYAQRIREGFSFRSSEARCLSFIVRQGMVTIRLIRESDAAAFREVLDGVCRERRYLAQLEAPSIERVIAFVSSNVKSGYPQFVAESDGKIVGWCDAIPGDPLSGATHIGRLGMGIAKPYRHQKIGRRLLEVTIQRAVAIGLHKIELTVHASNSPAIQLYRSAGFVEEGRRKRGWFVDGEYDDIILMAKELKAAELGATDNPDDAQRLREDH